MDSLSGKSHYLRKGLKQEIEQAERLEEEEMPSDVIRFNSMVTIKTPFKVEQPYQLVTPEKSDIARQKISFPGPYGFGPLRICEGR